MPEMPILESRLETTFRAETQRVRLRELHAQGDMNGLLEYALLLVELVSMGETKVQWLVKDSLQQAAPVEQCHMDWARDLLGELA